MDSGCCEQSTMGNEICIPFSALPFPASFILTYHTVLLLLPLLPHLSFLLEMSDFLLHVCAQTSAWPYPGGVRFCQQVCTWIKEAQNLGGGPLYRHRWRTPATCDSEKRSQQERSLTGQQAQPVYTSHICYERKWSRKGKCVTHIWLWMLFLLLLLNTQSCSSPCVC